MNAKSNLNVRWLYLATGVLTMLFAGIIYAWSILKVAFKDNFAWSDSALALNYTLTMCMFCLGGVLGGILSKKMGMKLALILAAIMVGAGFVLTGFLNADSIAMLYVSYAGLAGLGIGICYNVVISKVNAWFPDKKGLCTGCLMLGFGLSTLVLGSIISKMFEDSSIGWRKAFYIVGVLMAVIILLASMILKEPTSDIVFPAAKAKSIKKEDFEAQDYSTKEMLKKVSFWKVFIYITFVIAVGGSVISFARDLVISVGAAPAFATALVGVLSIFNGIGRILTGAIYDMKGRRFTMISANVLTIVAAGICLWAVASHSLPICILGLCLTGLSYGSCPTIASVFTSAFYGQKYFATNFSIMNVNLMFGSLMATLSAGIYSSTGSYVVPFIMLLLLSAVALGLNVSVRRP